MAFLNNLPLLWKASCFICIQFARSISAMRIKNVFIAHSRSSLLLCYDLSWNDAFKYFCCKLKKRNAFVQAVVDRIWTGSNLLSARIGLAFTRVLGCNSIVFRCSSFVLLCIQDPIYCQHGSALRLHEFSDAIPLCSDAVLLFSSVYIM